MKEIGAEAAKEATKRGFGLIENLIASSPHNRAVQEYIESIHADNGLTREQKAILTWNAKKNIRDAANLVSICNLATKEGMTEQKLLSVEQDWFFYFLEHASTASREDMQKLWARILVQECESPESIPKALIHTLSIMGRKEAETFIRLASFTFTIHLADGTTQHRPLVFLYEMKRYHLTLEEISALEAIGLLQYGTGIVDKLEDGDVLEYFGHEIKASDVPMGLEASTGDILLSHTGEALMRIVTAQETEGFFEKVIVPVFNDKNVEWDQVEGLQANHC